MKKPLSPDDPVIRKTVAIPSSIWRRIASFRFANEIPTEVEAVRRVMDAGLDVLAPAKTKRRATPAGEP